MELSPAHRRFLIVDQIIGAAVINVVLNGAIAWAVFRSVAPVPLWARESCVGVDFLATGFLLPFLTCLIVTRLVTRQVRDGKLPPLDAAQLPLSGFFRRSTARRGLLLGGAGVLFCAVPIVWALSLAQARPFALAPLVLFKAVWAGLLAAVFTPLIGWWALARASEGVGAASSGAAAALPVSGRAR